MNAYFSLHSCFRFRKCDGFCKQAVGNGGTIGRSDASQSNPLVVIAAPTMNHINSIDDRTRDCFRRHIIYFVHVRRGITAHNLFPRHAALAALLESLARRPGERYMLK